MIIEAKYGVQLEIPPFPIVKRGVVDFAVSADWTPATGDTKISKDGGNVANTTNNPAAIGGTGSALWGLTLTATEMQAARITVQIVDSATKAIEDQALQILTYGHASAHFVQDRSIALPANFASLSIDGNGRVDVIKVAGTTQTPGDIYAGLASLASGITTILSKLLKYFQLALRKDAAIATDNATELTDINANGGSGAGSYDNTTEAAQALRDNELTSIKGRVDTWSAAPLISGVVVADAGNTATTFKTNLSQTESDHFEEGNITFKSGDLAGQTSRCIAFDPDTGFLTVLGFSKAPAADDQFDFINK